MPIGNLFTEFCDFMNIDIQESMCTIEKLNAFDFKKVGLLIHNKENQKMIFSSNDFIESDKNRQLVYIWLNINRSSNSEEIIYIGKTQFSIHKRMKEHLRGFRGKENNGSISGSKKFKHLINLINTGSEIQIWTRQAENRELMIRKKKLEKISHYSVEEEYFIQFFNPNLNNKEFLKTL